MSALRCLLSLCIPLVVVCVCGAQIKDITWELGPNLPEYRKGGCLTVLDGKVISVFGMRQPWGEMATMYVYDPETDWWHRGPDAPVGQCYVQGAEAGDHFYAIGGRGALRRGRVHTACYRLGVDDGEYQWTRIQDLNVPRGWAPSVSIGSKLYVFGGSQGGHGPTLNGVEMIDLSQPDAQWQKISDIPGVSRGWCGAAAVGGKIYIFGGGHFYDPKPEEGDIRQWLNETLEFDPETTTWEKKTAIPYRNSGMDCCVYQDRYVILVGGWAAEADFSDELKKRYFENKDRNNIPLHKYYYCPFVQVYDVQTDQWTTMPSLMPFSANDIRVVCIGKKLYALAGENKDAALANSSDWLRIGTIIE